MQVTIKGGIDTNSISIIVESKKNCWQGVKNVTLNFIVFIMAPTVEVFYSQKMSENWKFQQKLFYWKNCNLKSPRCICCSSSLRRKGSEILATIFLFLNYMK